MLEYSSAFFLHMVLEHTMSSTALGHPLQIILHHPEMGTVQGPSASPSLITAYLHQLMLSHRS